MDRKRFCTMIIVGISVLSVTAAGLTLWSRTASTSSRLVVDAERMTEIEARGAAYVYGDDFGGLSASTLETHALPWKLSAAALMVAARRANPSLPLTQAGLNQQLRHYGFLTPKHIGNTPAGTNLPASDLPLGMTYGDLNILPGLPVQVSNLGCAACHAGVTYDADGNPKPDEAWLGLPNTSLDLEAYTGDIYRAYEATSDDADELMAAVRVLFPEVSVAERFSLRHLVLPRVRARLKALKLQGRPLPFPNGSPGATNGVAALKLALHVPMRGGGPGETGVTSIPDLGNRTWKTSLLYDGAYAPAGDVRQRPMTAADVTPLHRSKLATVATFFSVPSMGVRPRNTLHNQAKAEAVFAFIDSYRAPVFPGAIDAAAAARGQNIYAHACASCHGTYDSDLMQPHLLLFPNWIGDVGTDPQRAKAFTPELARAVNKTPYRTKMTAAATGAYVAPPLSGVWATAPYLHNGSVPTIADLLEAKRPVSFLVGGHRLDFGRLGIDTKARGYQPWSTPQTIDTRKPGLSNAGHLYGSSLTPPQKRDLIKYLKLL